MIWFKDLYSEELIENLNKKYVESFCCRENHSTFFPRKTEYLGCLRMLNSKYILKLAWFHEAFLSRHFWRQLYPAIFVRGCRKLLRTEAHLVHLGINEIIFTVASKFRIHQIYLHGLLKLRIRQIYFHRFINWRNRLIYVHRFMKFRIHKTNFTVSWNWESMKLILPIH